MERQNILICLGLLFVASALATVDPRGARPIEHGFKADKCATQKEWPFCSDDDWRVKCPSGCRIQGLMDKYDHDLLKKIELIRKLLTENTAKHRSADQVTKQTYDHLKDKLTIDVDNDKTYYDLAQNLRRRIVDLKIKIDRQLRVLASMKVQVKDQVIEMQRLEVDIDIKLRSCKGSCQGYTSYSVDQEGYVELNKQIEQLDAQSAQSIDTVKSIYVMKSRPLKGVEVDSRFKSKLDIDSGAAGQQRQDFFPEVKNVELILEEAGSSASTPATISKDPVCMKLKQKNQDGRHSLGHTDGDRRRRCPAVSDYALCSDDDWVSKCPSGCRLQGLISQMEMDVESKLRKVCERAKTYQDTAEKSMTATVNIYNSNRQVIVSRYVAELKYVEDAEELARKLTSLRKQSDVLSRQLKELRGKALEQIEDMYRTEVEVDIKLRACRGSCHSALPFSIDHPSYQALQTHMHQLEKTLNQRGKATTPPEVIPRIKLQPVSVGPAPSGEYKTIPMVQRELLTQFEDIEQNQVVLEELLEDSSDVEVLDPPELE